MGRYSAAKKGKKRKIRKHIKPTWKLFRSVILEYHGNLTDIAAHFNVTRRTIHNWISKDPTGKIKKIVEEAREYLLDIAEKSLARKVVDGNLSATIFLLKTLGKYRGYIEKQDYELNGQISVKIEEHTIQSKEDLFA